MTKNEFIIAQLHEADSHLRAAMVAAGEMRRETGRSAYLLVTNDIRESEWHLDEALAHAENAGSKKKSKKNLTSARECVKVGA